MNTLTNKLKPRGRFSGVVQIVRFNWPQYVIATAMLLAAYYVMHRSVLPSWASLCVTVAVLAGLWWSVASLVASHWVYDRSELMRWEWLQRELPRPVRRWLNVHAGLDESTPALRALWPAAVGDTVDIFAPDEMTAGSIHRARDKRGAPARRVNYRVLPFVASEFDTVFLLFAIHELRHPDARRKFFTEVRRVLASTGQVVLVEHLRDWPNLAAYGPGFLHFHSRRTWRGDIAAAGLKIEREFCLTPFVGVFILRGKP